MVVGGGKAMPKISAAKFETRSDRARGIFRFEYPGGREGGGGGEGIITITRACKPTNDDPSSCAGLS